MESTRFTVIESPIGPLVLAGGSAGLTGIRFGKGIAARDAEPSWVRDETPFREAVAQLRAYFAGERRDFDLALDPRGTPFQRRVWNELCRIPYGETISYGELARRVQSPRAARAVGLANGQNPLPIVVPCHRVIGAGGDLVGYGGGLDIKDKLLALERGQLAFSWV